MTRPSDKVGPCRNGWIALADRYPPLNGWDLGHEKRSREVLVRFATGHVGLAYYFHGVDCDTGEADADGWRHVGPDGYNVGERITHWQPTPEPEV